jgi:hypothetical protein
MFDEESRFEVYQEEDTGIGVIKYIGKLTPEVTAGVYKWMYENIQRHGIDKIRGGIFDFREVTSFHIANLHTIRRSSGNLNADFDMSHIPTALVVSNPVQATMVRTSLFVTSQDKRKKIVYSMEEGRAFIDSYHQAKV